MANKIQKRKQTRSKGEKVMAVSDQVIMLRTQGYTVRQICDILKIRSSTFVSNAIGELLDEKKDRQNISAAGFRNLELNRCDERFGRFAEWRNKIESMGIPLERQLQLILSIEDRDLKNQERLIKLLGLETQKTEYSDNFNFNALRERARQVEEKDEEIRLHPELTGRIR